VKCPTCKGRFAEQSEELDSLGNWLQVLRCINGHRFDRLKPVPVVVKPVPLPVAAAVYVRLPAKRTKCLECGREMPIQSRGLCGRCLYRETQKEKGLIVKEKNSKRDGICVECGRSMVIIGRGLCGCCYGRDRTTKNRASQGLPAKVYEPLTLPPMMEPEERMVALDVPSPGAGFRTPFALDLDCVLAEVRAMLVSKNLAYGDSALNPVRVFSQANPVEQLRVRIDDKISRLMRGSVCGEDTTGDLLGYLVLLRMAEARA
jgi:hypothetical protein